MFLQLMHINKFQTKYSTDSCLEIDSPLDACSDTFVDCVACQKIS